MADGVTGGNDFTAVLDTATNTLYLDNGDGTIDGAAHNGEHDLVIKLNVYNLSNSDFVLDLVV